jgi:hypothetical protein
MYGRLMLTTTENLVSSLLSSAVPDELLTALHFAAQVLLWHATTGAGNPLG